ncbi:FliM/FliN family flagellar motor switch protein [Pseudomonas fluorescens]|uniref:FliM/FliN family flagellar motor switch protein n=1 Tax=Pseudomonas fluorescens TaxID=294 RepID=UPI001BED2445|nr:FliM/FliN family flagellar motor switch protein [Pseudomonas fluorescens]MBT2375462.1 FliM/FliN family flagellar motor switch protein [Pseudomonas fluorescens]
MSIKEAEVRTRVGAGVALVLSGAIRAVLQIRLAPVPFSHSPRTAVETACGTLWLDNVQSLLDSFSKCPAIIFGSGTTEEASDWYWSLYNHYMLPELRALLSPLRVFQAAPIGGLDCLLEVKADEGGSQCISRVRMSPATVLGILERGDWLPVETPRSDDWRLTVPLILGYVQLSPRQLRSINIGDALFAEQSMFSCDGAGSVIIGSCRLYLQQETTHKTELRFTYIGCEEFSMPLDPPDAFMRDGHSCTDPDPVTDSSALDEQTEMDEGFTGIDDLPLTLTLRAGTHSSSFGELKRLSVGSVLCFSGCLPGQAQLYQGDRMLAQGDLVDIDGLLGLQITRLEIGR